MVATPGVGVGVVAATAGTSPIVVARSWTGAFAVDVGEAVGEAAGVLVCGVGAGAWAGAAVPLSCRPCAMPPPSCWRAAVADGAGAAG
jgi:hypothetical protein